MVINISGEICSNDIKTMFRGWDLTCPKDVSTALLKANGEDIEVKINSNGGDIFAASEMYGEMLSYKG